jgi:hypothetical protein
VLVASDIFSDASSNMRKPISYCASRDGHPSSLGGSCESIPSSVNGFPTVRKCACPRATVSPEILQFMATDTAGIYSYFCAVDNALLLGARLCMIWLEPNQPMRSLGTGRIATPWDEFRKLDWERICTCMLRPLVLDGCNLLNRSEMGRVGFEYYSCGRPLEEHLTS